MRRPFRLRFREAKQLLCQRRSHLLYPFYLCLLFTHLHKTCLHISLGLDDRGSISRKSWDFFCLATASRLVLGPTQPPSQWVPGALSPGLMRPEREACHSPPSCTEVKKAWGYTSTLPVCISGMVLD